MFDLHSKNAIGIALVDEFFAYDANFHGGVYVAAGELDGDKSRAEIVTGPGEGGPPDLKLWTRSATTRYKLQTETVIISPNRNSGLRVGIGNLSNRTDRQTIYVGDGPGVDYRLTTHSSFSDGRLNSFLVDFGPPDVTQIGGAVTPPVLRFFGQENLLTTTMPVFAGGLNVPE
jgi:hypothetical protein